MENSGKQNPEIGFKSPPSTKMATLEPRLTVQLGARSYPVYIGEGILPQIGPLARYAGLNGPCAIVSDATVGKIHGSAVTASLSQAGYLYSTHLIAPGEASKSFDALQRLAESVATTGLDRQGFIVALGGGVVGDLAGFLASIYRRGLPCIQIPTTVMAQVDSAVGGKTGINLSAGKNLVGSFHQPRFVLADTTTLTTLAPREWNEGFAEIIKYGIIREPDLLGELECGNFAMPELVQRCLAIKADFVARDEEERSGERALLNFGHTIGHAIEAAAGYGILLHGEAISLGIQAATLVSTRMAGLSAAEQQRVAGLLEQFALPTRLSQEISKTAILEKAFSDKKFVNRGIRFVVTPRLGSAELTDRVSKEDLEWSIAALADFGS